MIDWPDGADEELVRACNCKFCRALVEQLDNDGQLGLTAFGGAEA